MATYVSEHFHPDADDTADQGLPTRPHMASAGIAGARKRYKKCRILVTTAVTAVAPDQLRLMQFKSGDRIHAIKVSDAGASTVTAADLGLYKSGNAHDGAVIDADLFASALSLNGGGSQVEALTEAGTITDEDRGKTLWEMAALGAGSYTEDPFEDWDLTFTVTGAVTTATETILVEVEYTAGD